ncbi:ATP-binding protein [Candidatus Cardinium hertigii]|jgi:DNA polymerase-3 subunit delta'|uniref:DNA polymerase III subunit delta n=1 Tax=Candidatus Cardinium hertigii TaxID=247481 RepID=A0A3N2QD39_9BACT|nr:DNA polymerase III subunit delta [Candidatus Cardinium hertigii]ROT47681.1 DNA polymerase III subunit delta [Candidatus Cardinium hertigii]
MRFVEIPQHDIFKNALLIAGTTGKVAHAQLFVGPIGSANLALALAFATYLNCTARKEDDACGNCFACMSMAQFTHPDFQLVFPRKSDNSAFENPIEDLELFRNCLKQNPFLTLEEWTNAIDYDSKQCQITKKDANKIIQRLGLKAFIGPYKIVLIWLPEYLNNTAANILLKTLEEPPAHTIFLLVSFNDEKILPTIRSRSQPYNIPPFSEVAIEQMLRNSYSNLTIHRTKEIAFLAEGNMHKAFQLAKQTVTDNFERFSNWMRNCYSGNYTKLILEAEAFHKLSTDAQKNFFAYALQHIRVILLGKLNHSITTSAVEAAFSKKFGLNITFIQLKEMIALFTKAYYYLERNANAKMIYTNISIQIVKFFKAPDK